MITYYAGIFNIFPQTYLCKCWCSSSFLVFMEYSTICQFHCWGRHPLQTLLGQSTCGVWNVANLWAFHGSFFPLGIPSIAPHLFGGARGPKSSIPILAVIITIIIIIIIIVIIVLFAVCLLLIMRNYMSDVINDLYNMHLSSSFRSSCEHVS